jgi:hypothetical protein
MTRAAPVVTTTYEIVAFTKETCVAIRIPHDEYFADPKAHWGLLATVGEIAYCTCAAPAPRLRNRRWPGYKDGFRIAGWPYEGDAHSANCSFFKFSLDREGCARHIAAIRIQPGEKFEVTGDFELERPQSTQPTWEFERWCSRAQLQFDATSWGRTSLRGLLAFLLLSAGLNEYSPGQARDRGEARARLILGVQRGQLNNEPLAGRMCVMPTSHDGHRVRAFATKFLPTESASHRFLILSDLAGYSENRQSRIQLGAGGPALIVNTEIGDRLANRFPIPSAALESQRDVVLGLFLVEVQNGPGDILQRIRVVDGALTLLSSPSLIPVDSHHEALVANQLVKAERSFLKPMVVDSTLGMLPDFILRDRVSKEYVEVWGIDTEEYRQRMKDKIARYRELKLELIQWHAYRNDAMPDFCTTATGTLSDGNAVANQQVRKKTRAERYPS